MSELIRREDLENWLRTECASIDTYEDKEYVIGRLREDLPTIDLWHKAEDGLPDKYTQCLLADADGKCAVGYYRYDCKAWDNPAFGWIEMENRIYIDDIPMGIGKVVAWMPIEPPKEDNDG